MLNILVIFDKYVDIFNSIVGITRYILNTATIRIIRMTTVQMPDSKLHRYTSYIVETIRFDNNNVC